MTTAWSTYLATMFFVVHPDHLGRAQRLYMERLHHIPAERARIHFVSSSPAPETLELYSLHCIISYGPGLEDEVHEKLFFANHPDPDPFPGFLSSVEIEGFASTPAPPASRWLETEYSRLLPPSERPRVWVCCPSPPPRCTPTTSPSPARCG